MAAALEMLVPAHKWWSLQLFFWQPEDFGLLGLGFFTNTEKLEELHLGSFPVAKNRAQKVVLSLPPNLSLGSLLPDALH